MTDVIVTNTLTKRYGSKTVLDGLDLTIQEGEVFGYLGPNGAGKTTTLRLLLGLIKPTSGTARIFDKDIATQSSEIHQDMAYVPGETNYWPNMSGKETLYLLGQLHGKTDLAYQSELIQKFDFDPNKKVHTYSKGNRQKIALIAAFSTRAKLLLFDEPTSGLDPVMARVFRQEVLAAKRAGQTVLLSSHILEEVEELCDRLAVLRAGVVVETGTLEQLRHFSAVTMEATFSGKPPSLVEVAGVQNIESHDHFLRCQVHGPIDAVLQIISRARPLTLFSRKPSLEELFLALYSDNSDQSDEH